MKEYPFLPEEDILAEGKRNEAAGVHWYSIVTAGRDLHGQELERGLAAYRRLRKETGLALCASHGLQTLEELQGAEGGRCDRFHAIWRPPVDISP